MAETKANMGSNASTLDIQERGEQSVSYVGTTHAPQVNTSSGPEKQHEDSESFPEKRDIVENQNHSETPTESETGLHEDEVSEQKVSFSLPKKTDEFIETPVAYRNTDGTLKFYGKEEAPTYLRWNVSLVEQESEEGIEDVGAERTHTNSTLEDDESDIQFVKRKFWDIPEDSVRETDTAISDSLLDRDTSRDNIDTAGGDREAAVTEVDELDPTLPAPKPPRITRRDLIPNEDMFKEIDERSIKVPLTIQEDLTLLLNYLTQTAQSPLEKVRAFFMWITHHINYDTSGYFGYADLKSTEPYAVLRRKTTVCEGYTKLMEYFCRHSDIPVKTVSGFVKAYGYKPGDDVTSDRRNAHAWNAVFIDNNWFLLDVTWGAGYVKTRERKYIPRFNEVYFMTEPKVFIVDHFPNMDESQNYNESWQLLESPITKEQFLECVNMDKYGKEWAIEAVSHKTCVIDDIENELDVLLEETYIPMLDYLAFIHKDGVRLQQYTYTYKVDEPLVKTHVCMPSVGEFTLQIYGRKKGSEVQMNFKPIVQYVLKCIKAYTSPVPFPSNHTNFGPVHDLDAYGISEVGDTFNVTYDGEIVLPIKASRFIDVIPRLYFGDRSEELKTYCFVDFSPEFEFISIHARLPGKGFFKLAVYAQRHEEKTFNPFMTYLIECKQPYVGSSYPHAHEHALKFKCCLLEPRIMEVAAEVDIMVRLKAPSLVIVKGHETMLTKVNDTTFEGKVRSPAAGSWMFIYGSELPNGVLRMLYSVKTI